MAQHNFKKTTFTRPTWCALCGDFIWGLRLQGFVCVDCGFPVHTQCVSTVASTCGDWVSKKANKRLPKTEMASPPKQGRPERKPLKRSIGFGFATHDDSTPFDEYLDALTGDPVEMKELDLDEDQGMDDGIVPEDSGDLSSTGRSDEVSMQQTEQGDSKPSPAGDVDARCAMFSKSKSCSVIQERNRKAASEEAKHTGAADLPSIFDFLQDDKLALELKTKAEEEKTKAMKRTIEKRSRSDAAFKAQLQRKASSREDSELNASQLNPKPVSEPQCIREAWLEKQTVMAHGKRNTSRWQKRYFVLKQCCLFYYVVKSRGHVILRHFQLEVVDAVPVALPGSRSKIGYQFLICRSRDHPEGIIPSGPWGTAPSSSSASDKDVWVTLAARSGSELQKWVNALKLVEVNPDKCQGLSMEGALWVQTAGSRWVERYFRLKGNLLEYNERLERGYFPLTGAHVEPREDASSVSIVSPSKGVLNLRSFSSRDLKLFVEGINQEIKRSDSTRVDTSEVAKFIEDMRSVLETDTDPLACDNPLPAVQVPPELPYALRGRRYRILSLDGGGMRGLMNCILLERMLKVYPNLLDQVDMLAGTSNGAMLAMGIAYGKHPTTSKHLFELTAKAMFAKKSYYGVNQSRYSSTLLKVFCEQVWEKKTLAEARKHVCVPAFLMDNQHPDAKLRSCEDVLFHNLCGDAAMNNDLAADVVMRTVVAPTYFPSYQRYVDGGMFANDPASCALTLALSPAKLNLPLSAIVMLSMGTGKVNYFYDGDEHDWGYSQWITRLPNALWEGMTQKSEQQCQELLQQRYWRVQPVLQEDIAMDDPQQLPILTEVAMNYNLQPTLDWIQQEFLD